MLVFWATIWFWFSFSLNLMMTAPLPPSRIALEEELWVIALYKAVVYRVCQRLYLFSC